MITFNVDLTELKTALKLFSFIRPNETVVDYTFLQMTGIVHQPLKLSMTNGAIVAHAQVGAKITEDFEIRVVLNDLVNMIRHMVGVVTCTVTDKALIIANERVTHTIGIIAGTMVYPDVVVNPETTPMSLKPLLGDDWVTIQPTQAISFTNDRSLVRRITGKFGVTCTLTPVQAKLVSDLGVVGITVADNGIHVTDGGNNQLLFAHISGVQVPDFERIFAVQPVTTFDLTPTEAKELQTLLHSNTLVITVADGVLKFIASGDTNQSVWQKSGVTGTGFVKVNSAVVRDISGQATVSILELGHVSAIRIDNGNVTIIGAGLTR